MPRSMSTATLLASELDVFQKNNHAAHLQTDQAFIVWFLVARFGYSFIDCINALPARAQDNNVDAIFIDRRNRSVRIVQGKYRTSAGRRLENQNDVLQFALIATAIMSNDGQFNELLIGANDSVRGMLKEAQKLCTKENFSLTLHYVTTGSCSDVIKERANKVIRKAGGVFDLFVDSDVSTLLQKYLDAAPFLGTIDLAVDGDFLRQDDSQTNICSWIFSMSGTEVASMYARFADRLFALNVRAFQGENKLVNEGMAKTLKDQPQFFWFFNNGITMLCDEAKVQIGGSGRTKLVVTNPQIINGQQTTVMLSKSKDASRAKVAVRVIQMVPTDEYAEFEDLLTKIVKNTNSQTRVSPYQLVCNDRRQIALERELERKNYLYVRKRQGRGSDTAHTGIQRYKVKIDMVAMAKAVAACDLDPVYALRGADTLFQDHYEKVFPRKRDSSFYLPRYWLHECVIQSIGELPDSVKARVKDAQWVVTHIVWQYYLNTIVSGSKRAEQFREFCETRESVERVILVRAIKSVARACDDYLQVEKNKNLESNNPRDMLSHRGVAKSITTFWFNSRLHSHRKTFHIYWDKFATKL